MRRKRRARRRKTKKNFLGKLFWGLALIVFSFALSGFVLYYFSPDLKIKGLEIIGDKTASQEDIKKAAQDLFVSSFNFLGREIVINNIFVSLEGRSSKLMEQFPEIESINIKKDYGQGLVYLEILEKEPAAVWCVDNDCSLVDGKGSFIRSCSREERNELILINEGGGGLDKEGVIASAISLKEKIKGYGLKGEFFSLFSDKFVLGDVNGCDFIFDLNDDFEWQIEKLQAVLDQDEYLSNLKVFQHIDLRFGNQAIVKKKD